jgi:adenine phosphoribosyltransferase
MENITLLSTNAKKIAGASAALGFPIKSCVATVNATVDRPAQPWQHTIDGCFNDRLASSPSSSGCVLIIENAVDRDTMMDYCNAAICRPSCCEEQQWTCVATGKSFGVLVTEAMVAKHEMTTGIMRSEYGKYDLGLDKTFGEVWNENSTSAWFMDLHKIDREEQIECAVRVALFAIQSRENTPILMKSVSHYPDFPKSGIDFMTVRGIYMAEGNKDLLRTMFTTMFGKNSVDYVAGADSRGFSVAAMGYAWLDSVQGYVECFKGSKMPRGSCNLESYGLEYGSDVMGIELSTVPKTFATNKNRVVICDDTIATGGTILALRKLLEALGFRVVGVVAMNAFGAMIEGAKKKIGEDVPIYTFIDCDVAKW